MNKLDNLRKKYGFNIASIAQIEALKQYGITNNDINDVVKELTSKFKNHTDGYYCNIIKKYDLLDKDIPNDLKESEYFNILVEQYKLCFKYNVMDLWDYYLYGDSPIVPFWMSRQNITKKDAKIFKKHINEYIELENKIINIINVNTKCLYRYYKNVRIGSGLI